MTEQQFINQFVTAFLGSWAARHYEVTSLAGKPGTGYKLTHPDVWPVNDAKRFAKQAWDRFSEGERRGT